MNKIPDENDFLKLWPTMPKVMEAIYDSIPADLMPVFEPKKRTGVGGYHSPKQTAAGLYMMISENAASLSQSEFVIPQRITAQAISYAVLNLGVPLYHVADHFARAVAGTELPKDLRIEELKWPLPALVFAFPVQFMKEYLGIETSFVYAAEQQVSPLSSKHFPSMPEIEATEAKVSWMWYAWTNGRLENFVSSYQMDRLAAVIAQDFDYHDWTGASQDVISQNKAAVDKVSLLMLKLLCVLNWRDGLITPERVERPERIKKGEKRPALWSPNYIGLNYRRPAKAPEGTHASPGVHTRIAHWSYQVIGKREDFVPVASLPRTQDGYIDWERVGDETKQKFWRSHKRIWIDHMVVGLQDS